MLLCHPSHRHQQLQFRPSLEEIRAKYYREMKKFICIPLHFRGVGEASSVAHTIFPRMIARNAHGFSVVYGKVGGGEGERGRREGEGKDEGRARIRGRGMRRRMCGREERGGRRRNG